MDDARIAAASSYLRALLTGFCSKPEELTITPSLDPLGLTLTVGGDDDDLRLVIGRKGSIIGCIRRLMELYGRKNEARVNIFVPKKS